jgi:hypothetical protein
VVDNPDFLFLVPSQRLKRLNHHPQWRLGNFEERTLQFDSAMTKVEFHQLPQPWTFAEDEKLRALAASGERPTAIAEQLQRSEVAVRHRLWKLGISVKRIMIASAERTFAIHPERQFMHYLREQRWVKGTMFPPGQLAASLQKKGWIEQQRQGPKNETFYRITDAGLAALKAPVPIQASRAKLQSTGALAELRLKAKK